ncbi:hypothetical protein IWZ01DRAFT_486014 [Phyllosticta capitalensis]
MASYQPLTAADDHRTNASVKTLENWQIIAHHSRRDIKGGHVHTSLEIARQRDSIKRAERESWTSRAFLSTSLDIVRHNGSSKQAVNTILGIKGLQIVTDPEFRFPDKPLEASKYGSYLPETWAQCSDHTMDPFRIWKNCVKGNGLFHSCKVVATNSGVIYNGACMACVGSGSDAKCSIAAIDAEEIGSVSSKSSPQTKDEHNTKNELTDEVESLMCAMHRLATRQLVLLNEAGGSEGDIIALTL